MKRKKIIYILFLGVCLLSFGTPPKKARANVLTTPTFLPTCVPTITATSVLPPVELPTFSGWETPDEYSTPLPPVCVTAPSGGEVCYTATAPTGTPTGTPTTMPTVTPPPSVVISCPSAGNAMIGTTCEQLSQNSIKFSGTSNGENILSWNFGVSAASTLYVLVSSGENDVVYWHFAEGQTTKQVLSGYQSLNTSHPLSQVSATHGTYSENVGYEKIDAGDVYYQFDVPYSQDLHRFFYYVEPDNEQDRKFYFNSPIITASGLPIANAAYVVISTSPLQITGTPTPSGTPAPQDGCTSGAIETDLIIWQPPVITAGSCYTLLPALNFDIPDAVIDAAPLEIPSNIGAPGIELCTQFWASTMVFMGFDFMLVASSIVSIICAIAIAREFRK